MRDTTTIASRLAAVALAAACLLAAPSPAQQSEAGCDFHTGRVLFEAGRYAEASAAFERAVAHAPEVAEHYRWLGMAYGRMAEEGSWLRAPGLVKKTRIAFERAVELDGDSVDALETLRSFYLEAPRLLGGDKRKAEVLEQRIRALGARRAPPAPGAALTPLVSP